MNGEKMNQYFSFDKPIPSLQVYKLKFDKGKWEYIYRVQTPSALKDTKRKKPLYVSGSFLNLKLTATKNDCMVNLRIYCKDDLLKLFEAQRRSDLRMRKEFKQGDNKKLKLKESTFILSNKSQTVYNCWIVRPKSIKKDTTVFVGRN